MKINETTEQGLYYRDWLADGPKAAVMLVHGLGEHCCRYEHLASALISAGFSLYAMDLPAHGNSAGERGHIDSFDIFQDAIGTLHQRMRSDSEGIPHFILGHSMGGLLAGRYLLDHQADFSGALLSAPAIKSPQEPPAWQVALIKAIAKLFPKAKMLQLDASGVSRDPEVVSRYMQDPLISKDKLSAHFLVEMTNTMDELLSRAGEVNVPIRIMHGTADVMTAPSGSQAFYDACQSQEKELKFYEGLYHEIFNEPEQNEIIAECVTWMTSNL